MSVWRERERERGWERKKEQEGGGGSSGKSQHSDVTQQAEELSLLRKDGQ